MKHPVLLNSLALGLMALVSAQLASAQTIPATLAAPPGSVDTNILGMKMRIVQGNTTTQPTAAAPAEALISGKIIDQTTGLPLNNATPNPADGSYFYNIDRYINMHELVSIGGQTAGADNFSTFDTAPHDIPDDQEPGIPGVLFNSDDFAMEFTGYLQLPSGTVRFGVNSDDGFKLTIGSGVNTRVQALQLIILDGTRGFGNTEANITVTQAGIYPFRLLFWERGGANSGVELYTFAPGQTAGNRYLINDTNQANSIRSYRELVGNPPSILNLSPALAAYVDPRGNAGAVPPAPFIYADVVDGSTAVNTNTISLALDGTPLAISVTKAANITTVGAQSPQLLANSVHTNRLIFADSGGTLYTNTWTFTVGNYPTIPAAFSLASVDTTKPGFKARVYQMPANKNPSTGLVPHAERQIAGGYLDPTTGQAYANSINPSWTHADGTTVDPIGADGFFVMPTLINLHDQAGLFGAGGNFSANSVPAIPDDTVPGIPGTSLTPDNFYVMSIETILELNAGSYRLGVNSDDGFRLSAGRGPGEVVGIQLGTAGDRGFADTYMDFVVAANGLYPFRLMWWESAGGTAGAEFFVVDLATGTKTLINDLTGFTPIKAYRESVASRPYISRVLPAINYTYTFADEDVIIDITDGAIPLGAGPAELRINGVLQTISANKTGNVTTITRDSSVANLLASGANNLSLAYSFTEGGTNNTVTNTWAFTVPAYTWAIPASNKVPALSVTGSGFHLRTHQIDRSRDANQGNGGRHTGNNMPGPEMQIAGTYINPLDNLPFTNNAVLGPNPDGSWDVTDTLNHNSNPSAGNTGIFQAASDREVPGLPGTGTSVTGGIVGIENYTAEITTFLDLKAGAHVFGINVDDGYTVISAPNAQDTLGTLLAFRNAPGGNAGNPLNVANAAFNVVVPEDGIYPFRILFWQGGGGVNIELLHIDRGTGTQIPINDTSGSTPNPVVNSGNLVSPITAYNTYTGPVRPWVKFSVYPMPYIGVTSPLVNAGAAVTLWQNRDQQSGPGPIMRKLGLFNGSWNSGELQNANTAFRPFGDSVGAIVADLGAGPVGMVLDGVSVTPTVTDIPSSTDKLVLYTPPTPLSASSNHIAGLIYAGTTNYWIFNVITNVIAPAGVALPSSNAVQSARGFRAKVVQSATARANTVAAAEAHLTGTPANVATNGPNPDGSYTIPGIINWNVTRSPGGTGTENGNFATLMGGPVDDAVPGIPGTGLAGNPRFENVTAEIFAYLDLPAGYQKFGVNGDDGWRVQIGTPGQTSGTVLFSHDRGGGATDFPFAFITPVAGLYPIRLLWYQGTGGGNLEFFTYGPNNEKIPVNHSTHPNAIKAYSEVTMFRITSVTVTGGNVTVTWTGGGTLFTATSLDAGTIWTSTGDTDGSYTAAIGSANLFFRAQQ